MSTGRAPVQPQPVDLPWAAVPNTVDVTAADGEAASALWDREMDGYEGLLEAEETGG